MLIQHIETESKRLNISRLYLKVSNENSRAIRGYEKNGYRVFKNESAYMLMEKRLT